MKTIFTMLGMFMSCGVASAQVTIDVDSEIVRKTAGYTYLDDLSINDTAIIYPYFCNEDDQLFVPGWVQPSDLAASTYASTGVTLKVTVLAGKRIKATYIDAAQAQSMAKGNSNAVSVLSKEDYKKGVLQSIDNIFDGGFFGSTTCSRLRDDNPLRTLNLFAVDSINGAKTISALMKSLDR